MRYENGNALFLILIAVALFAALSYAITSSSRGSGNINKEQAQIASAQVLQYLESINQAMLRMKVVNGCSDDGYNFETTVYQANNSLQLNNTNSKAPADGSCDVFDQASGGVTAIALPSAALDLSHPEAADPGTYPNAWQAGHLRIAVTQLSGIGTDDVAGTESANDMLFISNYLNKETCMKINDAMGVTNPAGDAPTITLTGPTSYYVNGSLANGHIWTVTNPVFCRKGAGAEPVYQLIYTVIER